MRERYEIILKDGTGEVVEKKSRFIANLYYIEDEEDAIQHIEAIRKKHYDARHNCFAYIYGEKNENKRASDDGEPSGTAGKPMLDILEGSGLHNVLAVVTRYFGGTLLGTGGLVRAYSAATKAGLEDCVRVMKEPGVKLRIDTDYNGIGKLQYLMAGAGVVALDTKYDTGVSIVALVPDDRKESFIKEVTEATAGKATMEEEGDIYFGTMDGETKVFGSEG